MDRTNISILLATALLGVLLYVVRQIGNTGLDAVTPAPRAPAPEVATAQATRVVAAPETTESALPVVDGAATLIALLNGLGHDGVSLVDEARRWYAHRGFIGDNPLPGREPDTSLLEYYASLDEATLRAMSQGGDVGATHELAARARLTDPFRGQQLLSQAAAQGSINAWIQIASFQETLADVRPEDFASDPEFTRDLARVGGRDPERQLRYLAFVNAVTALRDGGEPVMDEVLLDWVRDLGKRIPADKIQPGCNASFANFIAYSRARRARGVAPMHTAPPPVFLGRADADTELPCADTLNPIVSNLDLGGCSTTEVVDERGALRILYICAAN